MIVSEHVRSLLTTNANMFGPLVESCWTLWFFEDLAATKSPKVLVRSDDGIENLLTDPRAFPGQVPLHSLRIDGFTHTWDQIASAQYPQNLRVSAPPVMRRLLVHYRRPELRSAAGPEQQS
jgi:hypothetical protein